MYCQHNAAFRRPVLLTAGGVMILIMHSIILRCQCGMFPWLRMGMRRRKRRRWKKKRIKILRIWLVRYRLH